MLIAQRAIDVGDVEVYLALTGLPPGVLLLPCVKDVCDMVCYNIMLPLTVPDAVGSGGGLVTVSLTCRPPEVLGLGKEPE